MSAQSSSQPAKRAANFKVQQTTYPVPPGLVSSPYLQPSSIFVREDVYPKPSATNRQEQWLMDTVPQQPQRQPAAAGHAQPSHPQQAKK